MLVTDDADIVAQAVIMSGAYEHMWKKHPVLQEPFGRWQNRLPVYNLRMSNLSAAVIRPQLEEIERRVHDGLVNHNYLMAALKTSPFVSVPSPLEFESRAPDSIQFNLPCLSEGQRLAFIERVQNTGVHVVIFGSSENNARAFWNWHFLPERNELPRTRHMLMQACDLRLPAALSISQIDSIANIVLDALEYAGAIE